MIFYLHSKFQFLSYALYLYFFCAVLSANAFALQFPEFELAQNESVTVVNTLLQDRKIADPKFQDSYDHQSHYWIRMLVNVAPEQKKHKGQEYLVLVPKARSAKASSRAAPLSFEKQPLEGQVARVYQVNQTWAVEPFNEEDTVSQDLRTAALNLAGKKTYLSLLTNVAASRDFQLQKDYTLNSHEQEIFYGEGSIRLLNVSELWGEQVAEFKITFTRFMGLDAGDHCSTTFKILQDDGRPVFLASSCRLQQEVDVKNQKKTLHTVLNGQRHFYYSDKQLSSFIPKPLPALHPQGKIVDMAFSDSSGLLAFLNEDYFDDTQWLSYWDINRRQLVKTERASGRFLSLSDAGRHITNTSRFRLFKNHMLLADKFVPFGSGQFMDLDRSLIAVANFGVYPLSLNEKNELEVFNLGWSKQIFRLPLGERIYEQLAVAQDGRLLFGNSQGQFAQMRIDIDNTACSSVKKGSGEGSKKDGKKDGKKIQNEINKLESWCEGAELQVIEPLTEFNIELGLNILEEDQKSAELRKIPTGLSLLALHENKSVAIYCARIKLSCALLNLEDKKHIAISGKSAQFVADTIHTTDAIYNTNGELIEGRSLATSLYADQIAIAEKQQATFLKTLDLSPRMGDKIELRDIATEKILSEIKPKTFPVNTINYFGGGELVVNTKNSEGVDTAYVLNLKNLSVDKQAFDFPLQEYAAQEKIIFFRSLQFSGVVDIQQQKPYIIEMPVSDYSFVDNGLVFSAGEKVYRFNFKKWKLEQLLDAKREIYELLVLDEIGEQLVLRVSAGELYLPHEQQTIDAGYANAPYESLIKLPQGGFLASGLRDDSGYYNSAIPVIKHFDEQGKVLAILEPTWSTNSSQSIGSNNTLWSGNVDGSIEIRDLSSGLLLNRFNAHSGRVSAIVPLDRGRMASASLDGTVKIWREQLPGNLADHPVTSAMRMTGNVYGLSELGKREHKLLATFIVDADGEFIVSAADGLYWGSPKALHTASFVNDSELVDYHQFDYWLNRPDAIVKRLGYASDDYIEQWQQLTRIRRQRHANMPESIPEESQLPQLQLSGPSELMAEESVTLDWQSEHAKVLHVAVNGVPIYGLQGKAIRKQKGNLSIPLTPGENKIRAFVTDASGVASRSQYRSYNRSDDATKSSLYLLAIGVSDYDDDNLDLNYAQKDAVDMGALLSQSQAYKKVNVELITDKDVRRETVLKAKNFLQKAAPNDTVVVFMAGHGFLSKTNDYYFGTRDIDPFKPEERGLSYADINYLLDGIASRSKLLMLDTCHSGEVNDLSEQSSPADNVVARGIKLSRAVESKQSLSLSFDMLQKSFIDLRSSTGAVVISAAGRMEYALEDARYSNGVFTASVLKGLGEAVADLDKDGRVSTSELRQYTYDEVSRLTKGSQKPTTRSYNLENDFQVF